MAEKPTLAECKKAIESGNPDIAGICCDLSLENLTQLLGEIRWGYSTHPDRKDVLMQLIQNKRGGH